MCVDPIFRTTEKQHLQLRLAYQSLFELERVAEIEPRSFLLLLRIFKQYLQQLEISDSPEIYLG